MEYLVYGGGIRYPKVSARLAHDTRILELFCIDFARIRAKYRLVSWTIPKIFKVSYTSNIDSKLWNWHAIWQAKCPSDKNKVSGLRVGSRVKQVVN